MATAEVCMATERPTVYRSPNPFFLLSAGAMLLGCYAVQRGLVREPGQLSGLLSVLVALQLYEGLVLGLVALLASARHAVAEQLALLELAFLLDVTLLSCEVSGVSGWVSAISAAVLAALVATKLRVGGRAFALSAPGLARRLLIAEIGVTLGLPAVFAGLAAARAMGPWAPWLGWWVLGALLAAKAFAPALTGGTNRLRLALRWAPCVAVAVHLLALGYMNGQPLALCFLAPLLLARAIHKLGPEPSWLPALAILTSLSPDGLEMTAGTIGVAPFRVAAFGAAAVWSVTARRGDAAAALAATLAALAGLLGSTPFEVANRSISILDHAPNGVLGWGMVSVVLAFVLLGVGAQITLGESWIDEDRRRATTR